MLIDPSFEYGVQIFLAGDEILHKPCNHVTIDDIISDHPSLKQARETAFLALQNFRTKNGFGRAIAAPQVGFPIRLIAMNIDNIKYTLYNPVIVNRSIELFHMWDDCLSFPDLVVCVQRHRQVSVRFIDGEGIERLWENLSLSVSELLQHEIDHLDGILAIDRAVKPNKKSNLGFVCEDGILKRDMYLSNKELYDSLVDYCI